MNPFRHPPFRQRRLRFFGAVGLLALLGAMVAGFGLPSGRGIVVAGQAANAPFSKAMAVLTDVNLTLALPKQEFEAGVSVPLNVTINNKRNGEFAVGFSAFDESSFRFIVKNEANESIPLTAYGQGCLTAPTAVLSNFSLSIPKHSQRRYQFPLARMFDLSRSGLYTVTVQRSVITGFKKGGRYGDEPQFSLITGSPISFQVKADEQPFSVAAPAQEGSFKRDYLYVANRMGRYAQSQGSVARYEVLADGRASATLDSVNLTGREPTSLVITADNRFLYVLNLGDNTISQFRIGNAGRLEALSPATVKTQIRPRQLALSPLGRLLLVNTERGVQAFQVTPKGTLKYLCISASVPSPDLTFHPSGRYCYAINGAVHQYAVQPNGAVRPLAPAWVLAESSPYDIKIEPTGHFAYVATFRTVEYRNGESYRFADFIAPFKVNPNGTLTRLAGGVSPRSSTGTSFGTNQLALDRSGRFLYALNSQRGFVSGYHIGSDGSLQPIPGGLPKEGGEANAMAFDSTQRFAYVVRGYYDTLFSYRCEANGRLTPLGIGIPSEDGGHEAMANAVATVSMGFVTAGNIGVAARFDQEVVTDDEPKVLIFTMKNSGTQPVYLGDEASGALPFEITVMRRDERNDSRISSNQLARSPLIFGPTVPATLYGHKLLESQGEGNGNALYLKAGEAREYRVDLSRLFDLSQGGTYLVQVKGKAGSQSPTERLLTWPVKKVQFKIDNPYWHWSSNYLETLNQSGQYVNGWGVPFGEIPARTPTPSG